LENDHTPASIAKRPKIRHFEADFHRHFHAPPTSKSRRKRRSRNLLSAVAKLPRKESCSSRVACNYFHSLEESRIPAAPKALPEALSQASFPTRMANAQANAAWKSSDDERPFSIAESSPSGL
jgi:hypothetical protein